MYLQVRAPYFALAASIVSLLNPVVSEPVQYCKYGAATDQIDFCVGVLMHHNISTTFHDLYLTMSVSRPDSTSLGWTAVGLGEVMEGALMFIVYGDPKSSEQPIVSIRKSTGHKQPTLVTREDMNGADLRVIRADWVAPSSPSGSSVAMVSLVCYSCHLWPGAEVSATSKSQPWMWAWNSKQAIPVFTYDAHLKMHAHHAGAGGWGNFYVDMSRSVNNWHSFPSFPPIRPGIRALGVSESPKVSVTYWMAWLKHNPGLHAHGIIMGAAFLLLFPIGILAMRYGSTNSFKYHWILQLITSGLFGVGFLLGLMLKSKINTVHQVLGILLIACLGVQNILGWRHHIVFLRLRHRTWLSHFHIWLGRFVMIGGWSNLITGLILRGYSNLCIALVGCLVGSELVGLITWLWLLKLKVKSPKLPRKVRAERHKNNDAEYFALGEDDDEDDVDANSLSLVSLQTQERSMLQNSKNAEEDLN
jgi:hypothetical protein